MTEISSLCLTVLKRSAVQVRSGKVRHRQITVVKQTGVYVGEAKQNSGFSLTIVKMTVLELAILQLHTTKADVTKLTIDKSTISNAVALKSERRERTVCKRNAINRRLQVKFAAGLIVQFSVRNGF